MHACVCVCRKDKQLAEQVREKLSGVDAQLLRMHGEEKMLERQIKTKSDQKKLSIF